MGESLCQSFLLPDFTHNSRKLVGGLSGILVRVALGCASKKGSVFAKCKPVSSSLASLPNYPLRKLARYRHSAVGHLHNGPLCGGETVIIKGLFGSSNALSP